MAMTVEEVKQEIGEYLNGNWFQPMVIHSTKVKILLDRIDELEKEIERRDEQDDYEYWEWRNSQD